MDDNLKVEIESILQMKDLEAQKNAAYNISVYLLTLPPPPKEYNDLLLQFLDKIFEILPSSSIPNQLKTKLGINRIRQRRISFSGHKTHILPKLQQMSNEGREQQMREMNTLSITSTDTQRKFIPKQMFISGLECNTKVIKLIIYNLENNGIFNMNEKFPKKFSKPKISMEKILQNPEILRDLKSLQ